MKKLNLKKKVVSVLSDEETKNIKGGGTTSYSNCTGFLCCSPKGCAPASEITCPSTYQPGCDSTIPTRPIEAIE